MLLQLFTSIDTISGLETVKHFISVYAISHHRPLGLDGLKTLCQYVRKMNKEFFFNADNYNYKNDQI